jgi:putative ABC transport system permease protein
VQVFGFDPDHLALNLPDVNQQLQAIKLPDSVLFDRGARGTYDRAIARLERGEVVTAEMERRTIAIRGLFRMGASFGADATLVTSDQNFLRLFPRRQAGSISLGLLQVQAGYDPERVATALQNHLPSDVSVMTLAQYIRFEESFWKSESPIGFIFGLGTAMAFVVGVVIVYQVLSTDVNAHMKKYATFKAMGYRHIYLLGVVFEEALILAFLGFVPGFVLPIGLYSLASKATSLPIAMTAARATFVLSLTVFMCLMSGAIATRKLQAADPADMF